MDELDNFGVDVACVTPESKTTSPFDICSFIFFSKAELAIGVGIDTVVGSGAGSLHYFE